MQKTPITVAYGDGIGPEIMRAVLRVLEAGGAQIEPEPIEIGESVYRRGHTSGIEEKAWESLRRTRVFLKAPITTPQGGGYKSLNVTVRKTLGLYANVRPVRSYEPFIATKHGAIDLVIVRENEEDLYAGIEHQQTDQVVQCLKLISRPGTERIVRYAFEFARRNGRKRVTCITKDNIMKLTDGLFHRIFEEVGREYPEIQREHMIVDIGAARLAETPERFDVILAPNLYGDILSDIAAEVAGSVGLAGSANVGDDCAMFEAVHGSAPDIAGRGIANPSGLLQAAVLMLVHIGQPEAAARIQNAWLKTLEDGLHTPDIYDERTSRKKVGTEAFADAIIERLGQMPEHLSPARFSEASRTPMPPIRVREYPPAQRELVGVDVFFCWRGTKPEELAGILQPFSNGKLRLTLITNRGVKVWPGGFPETFRTDHWRGRFMSEGGCLSHRDIVELLGRLAEAGLDFIKTEHLYTFDGKPGYSLGQGQ
ncbi:MAG: NADP-dependent isocitrate dehydrogenase [Meiothermus sp.]|uniref:NADP-dependent isocitrate dehydrogenase n=1 Tax=Meiothermus sp. TaxID=1955249 RepID=UPI0025F47A59|nr:NADP-dependent isocitrate dehydrogenase [Meiothermus sp.]MCS7058203.1 NADP-dependent isocitrate dehydrogenase [Meiothermus sp.]MCS7194419.1 NADP-dependent isocitrate dehydrogenase [Meiothermus sp.]MCX7739463.1 NADP-dependent isocitrate dehydrogenase [Meiothermus sp.]MDW8091101.1 NADP-dependent isocitrate dehydrogenase [Meiothermus sp.]MDW8481363.1 NADP-dependent isocitrate dehydrogenase [Meiothermus sp.]